MSAGRITFVGDSCVALSFGDEGAAENRIDPTVNARCISIAVALERLAVKGVRDVVPSYNAVTLHYDSMQVGRHELAEDLQRAASVDRAEAGADIEAVEIPVRYGGEFGPDLRSVAEFAGCADDEVVRLHSTRVYRVYMVGFLPGFAYMGTVEDRIAMPRLETPRPRVAAGSVGIAASQTGIYPCDSPGGWRVIGRTTIEMFDLARPTPSLLKAGDRVKFVPV